MRGMAAARSAGIEGGAGELLKLSNKIKLNNVAKIQRQALQTLTEEEEEQAIRHHRSRCQRDWEHKSKRTKRRVRCHCRS